MRQALKAGGEIDVLTKSELQEGLQDWIKQTVIGARPIRFSAQAAITAAGTLSIGGKTTIISGKTGPDQGFLWIVRRLCVAGLNVATDPASVFLTDPDAAGALVYPNLTGVAGATGYKSWNSGELVLQGDDAIIVASTAAVAATGTVTLTGAALEFPQGLAWKYLS